VELTKVASKEIVGIGYIELLLKPLKDDGRKMWKSEL
jgi:hypothetical protein